MSVANEVPHSLLNAQNGRLDSSHLDVGGLSYPGAYKVRTNGRVAYLGSRYPLLSGNDPVLSFENDFTHFVSIFS